MLSLFGLLVVSRDGATFGSWNNS